MKHLRFELGGLFVSMRVDERDPRRKGFGDCASRRWIVDVARMRVNSLSMATERTSEMAIFLMRSCSETVYHP